MVILHTVRGAELSGCAQRDAAGWGWEVVAGMIPVNGMLERFKPHGTSQGWRTSPGPKQVLLQLGVSAGSGLETGRREFASFRG